MLVLHLARGAGVHGEYEGGQEGPEQTNVASNARSWFGGGGRIHVEQLHDRYVQYALQHILCDSTHGNGCGKRTIHTL